MRRLLPVVVVGVAMLAGASPAAAVEPWWNLNSGARPTHLERDSEGEIVLTVENIGDADTSTEGPGQDAPAQIVDTLPVGLEALGIAASAPKSGAVAQTEPLACSLASLSCTLEFERTNAKSEPELVPDALAPYDAVEVRIKVKVRTAAASGEENKLSVTGGGAPEAQVSRPLQIGGDTNAFGIEDYELKAEAEGGASATQAGGHPFQMTGTIALDQSPDTAPLGQTPQSGPAVATKDMVARLPPGLIANPSTVQRCLQWEFLISNGLGKNPECAAQTAVGVASVTIQKPAGGGTFTLAAPIFNIEPEVGEPARFGFLVPGSNVPVQLNTGVRSGPGEDWGVDLSALEVPQNAGISSVRVTFWGAPRRASHNDSRGWACLDAARGRTEQAYEPCANPPEEAHPPAFVTMPTSCTGAMQSSLEADSWAAPGHMETFPSEPLQALSGCSQLEFSPTISTEPSTHSAASPSGLSFDLNFNTEGLSSASGLAQSDLEKTVVTLPEGVTIDPSAGVGLGACTESQYAEATLNSAPGVGCPENSKLGTVEIETPLLFTTVYGSLYIAQPYENPFSEPGHPNGSLLAIYVIARSRAERGILIKLTGKVTPNPVTGQLTIGFENDPQLPFEHFNFHFREGQQAPLISPAKCGSYTTRAQLTPFSEPSAILNTTSSFQITSGSEGSACPSGALPPFAPRIAAGTLNDDAGVFSPFYVELTRTDAMQEVAAYSTILPLGETADLAGVPFCPEAAIEQARHRTGIQEEREPSCPAASAIGHTIVGTGVGAVLDYVPGTLYFSGPFHGDPFSVVSVISAVIGPFDLGTVVIRFGLRIDPYTAQVSIDPTGSEPIPTIIDGIVTHVRDIRVSIDRSGFTLNPTNCTALPVASTLTSNYAQSTTVSTPFTTTRCQELSFKPKFTASTQAHTSRARGASLSVKLAMGGTLGKQANIKRVRVELPKQMPSRLTTLQQACTEAQFNANPAGCPPGSFIGSAKAITPILPVPLQGPAIFVSHGGEAFPSLVLMLQGDGVTIDLVGSTFISPAGITSTTFQAVPDEPVGAFELTLPEGKYSALFANGNLCKLKLKMPTSFIAQNGATLHQNTPIQTVGCPPRLSISARSIKRRTLTLSVYVPGAGRLTVAGKGLKSVSRKIKGRESFTLKLTRRGAWPRRTTIRASFTPSAGKQRAKQTKLVVVRLSK